MRVSTPTDPRQTLRGQQSVCDCGAESPASIEPMDLDDWEDQHVMSDCPSMEAWREQRETVDEDTGLHGWPGLPAMDRVDADVVPQPVQPVPFRPRRLKSELMAEFLNREELRVGLNPAEEES